MALFIEDAAFSVAGFKKFSVHAIKAHFGDDALIHSYEDSNNPVDRELDLKFGIDGVIVDGDDWSHNYASRVCRAQGYPTFTVRAERLSGTKTELAKLRQVDTPKPEYHIQAYVDEHGAIVGIAERVEILRAIAHGKATTTRNRNDGTEFKAVKFVDVEGCRIYRVDISGNVVDVTADYAATA